MTQRTRVICIVPRLGPRVAGGKMLTMYRRLNLLASFPDLDVVLVNLTHSVTQKQAFADLQAQGVIETGVTHASLFELATPVGFEAEDPPHTALPAWDEQFAKGGTKTKVTYLDNGRPVMRDSVEPSQAGPVTIRHVMADPAVDTRLKYLDDSLVESLSRFGDGMVEKCLYAHGTAVRTSLAEHGDLQQIECAVTRQCFETEIAHQKALAAIAFDEEDIVFLDGITSAYLSPDIRSNKLLFLHADHRAPDGTVVPRSRYLIESFDGAIIVTATEAHKARIMSDLVHKAPIRVIPHYAEHTATPTAPRRDICTVSRLDLDGKPIHHAVEAFVRVMHAVPGCRYLIYGAGPGAARLEQLIKHHRCEDRIKLMGHTANPGEVFARAGLSLAPTLTEEFGLSLLEALTHGCPVITYDVDYGPRELIKPGINGALVPVGNIDALARAILQVYDQRIAYSSRCAQSVEPYGFDRHAAAYRTLIDDLRGRNRWYDIAAPDLMSETKAAFLAAPWRDKRRLIDVFIDRATEAKDVAALYWGFQHKHALHPQTDRPLRWCIWLSRRLGNMSACHAHLAEYAQRFPDAFTAFVAEHPEFDGLIPTEATP